MRTIILKPMFIAKVKNFWKAVKKELFEMYREEYLVHYKFFNFFNIYLTKRESFHNYHIDDMIVEERCIATGKVIKKS